jgi:hypothetical protein
MVSHWFKNIVFTTTYILSWSYKKIYIGSKTELKDFLINVLNRLLVQYIWGHYTICTKQANSVPYVLTFSLM